MQSIGKYYYSSHRWMFKRGLFPIQCMVLHILRLMGLPVNSGKGFIEILDKIGAESGQRLLVYIFSIRMVSIEFKAHVSNPNIRSRLSKLLNHIIQASSFRVFITMCLYKSEKSSLVITRYFSVIYTQLGSDFLL